MNITTESGRPSRNSLGIHNTPLQPSMSMTLLSGTPVNPATVPSLPITVMLARSILPDNSSYAVTDTSNPNTSVPISSQDRQVEVLTPCTRQHDRFVDPEGMSLQLGTVIFCKDLPFIVLANDKIYNYMGGNMKQLHIADPSEHKILVKETNRPSTFSNILDSVLCMLPGFCKRQNNASPNTKEVEDKEQATPEASTIDTIRTLDNSNSGKNSKMGNNVDNVTESNTFLSNVHNTSDIADFYTNTSAQNDIHNSGLFPTETMFPNHCACNKMLSH